MPKPTEKIGIMMQYLWEVKVGGELGDLAR